MRKSLSATFVMMICLVIVIFVSGCETVKGVGRDIEGASTVVQRSFDKR